MSLAAALFWNMYSSFFFLLQLGNFKSFISLVCSFVHLLVLSLFVDSISSLNAAAASYAISKNYLQFCVNHIHTRNQNEKAIIFVIQQKRE